MLTSSTLRYALGKPLSRSYGAHSHRVAPFYSRRTSKPVLSPTMASNRSRWYSSATPSVETSPISSFFTKKTAIKCNIKVTMRLKSDALPQAQFSASTTHLPLDGSPYSIPVLQKKQPATMKLMRAVAGLQKNPVLVKNYSTTSPAKPDRRRKKPVQYPANANWAMNAYKHGENVVARWLASVYGGDASDDALEKSKHAVNVAMACNLVCFLGKIVAFAYTGSASVFSEALHSLADLANQILLAMGITRSKRGPSEKHPFGSGNERYVWGLASAVSLFFVGAGASIYHGVSALYDPPQLESLDLALYMLLFSAVLEGISIWVAMEAVRQGAADNGMTFWQYCLNGPDPMGVAVLLEDGAAMAGLVIAGACTGLSFMLGSPIFDAIGSIAIGGLLGVAASFLINKNSSALLGQSMPQSKFNTIVEALRNDNVILDVQAAKGIMIGADVATFSAEVDFDHTVFVKSYLERFPADHLHHKITSPEDVSALLSDFCQHTFADLGVQINRLEEKIQSLVPEVQFVDIEVN